MTQQFDSQEFLQDYRAEVADHLQSISKHLLALEDTLKPDATPVMILERAPYLEGLFRSFHTIKGLSGMVGLDHAAGLSHIVESLLRQMLKAEIEIDSGLIDRLLQAQKLLQTLVDQLDDVTAVSNLQPDMSALRDKIQMEYFPTEQEPLAASGSEAGKPEAAPTGQLPIPLPNILADHLNELERNKIIHSLLEGKRLGTAIFVPSPEKQASGMNVSEVRKQLQDVGDLIKAAPMVSGSAVSFIFLVALPEGVPVPIEDVVEWSFPNAEEAPAKLQASSDPRSVAVQQPGIDKQPAQGRSLRSPSVTMVRVDLITLEEIFQQVSELVVEHSRLKELLPLLKGAPTPALDTLNQTTNDLSRTLKALRKTVMSTRMVPLADAFSPMPLAIRDLARGYGKEIQLTLEGENTQVDRILVERLLEPLLHLVRNAIAHGIEPSDQRQAAGKPRVGHICISGQPQGEWIKIVVEDDGRGIDMAAVEEKARKLGLIEKGQEFNSSDALDLISMPGFSTQKDVNMGAGRGMGMEVVMRSVRSMHGSLSLQTEPGKYTRFSLRLPLTLTIMNVILVRSAGETYAIPQTAVDELIEIEPQKIVTVESGQLYPYKDASLPLIHLRDLFQFHFHPPQEEPASNRGPARMQYALINGKNENPLALVVDRLLGIRESVVRTLPDPLVAQPYIAGATELGDGSLVLILDLLALLEIFRQRRK